MTHCAVVRVAKLQGAGKVKAAAAHNKRTIQAELGARGHINPLRTTLNESLHGLASPDAIATYANDRMAAAGITKLRKDAVRAVEWLFSLPANHAIDDTRFFAGCVQWVADNFGGAGNLLCADIHRDEAAPHCHVLVLPLIDGKMNGSAAVGGRAKVKALKEDFHNKVAKGYGLRRETGKLQGAQKNEAVAMVLKRLNEDADPALVSAVWQYVREAIGNDPRPYMQALGLELPQRPLRRTMAQIFTSKGKGAKVEPVYQPVTKPRTQSL
jgi:Plasmid recombination enzyme